jgi:hypothetical protein
LDNPKIHWLRWSSLANPKGAGGMGFREMKLFNQALPGKQGWRLISNPNLLCSRVLKGKYFPNSITTRRLLGGLSFMRGIYLKRLIKRVGSGSTIDVE